MRTVILLFAALALAAQDDPPEVHKEVIVVTGTYEPLPLEEADRTVTSRTVRGDNTLVSNTIVDFLNLDPSVDLRQRGTNNIQTDVSIRGSTFGQTLVLLNGLRLNDVQSGHHNMNLPVPLDSIERVEVLKGSGSTLYGSDAVGGVIHFISRPPEASEFRLRGALGNFGVNQQRASAAWVRENISQQFAAWRDFSTGFIPNRDYRNSAASSTTNFRTALGTSEILLAAADRPFGAEQFYGNFDSWERTKSWYAGARQSLGERTSANFMFRRHTDLFVLYRYRPQVFTNRHATESYQGSLRRWDPLGTNGKLHYGSEVFHDSIVSSNLGTHDRARGAGYIAYDLRALRRFSFNFGARHEVYGSLNGELSPTASAGAWLSPKWKLRASASRAFRLPTFTDLYYQDPANIGSPGLRPESAWTYEGGIDFAATDSVRAELTVFHRRERDGIDFVRTSPTDLWRATNFQSLRFTGVEAGVSARAARRHVFEFRYTGLHGAQDQLTGVQSRYTFNYPSHFGIAGWQAALPNGLIARARIAGVQRYTRDPYALVDLYAARSRGRFRPFVQLTNLTNSSYQEILGVAMPGRGVVGGLELVVYTNR
jgi:iron complex outermembrane recepter protein